MLVCKSRRTQFQAGEVIKFYGYGNRRILCTCDIGNAYDASVPTDQPHTDIIADLDPRILEYTPWRACYGFD